MEKITSPEFEHWVQDLVRENASGVVAVFKKFNISALPTPHNVMLAAIKYKDDFINALADVGTLPEGTLYATGAKGKGLKPFIVKALAASQGITTAASVLNHTANAKEEIKDATDTKTEQEKEEEENSFLIFGKHIPKLYVYIGSAIAAVALFFTAKSLIK